MNHDNRNWKPYGGNKGNFGTFESQQYHPVPALIEKITNSIDATLIDEYLSLKMSYEAKLLLHTKIRSKGGCLLCAMHYLPDEQKLKDLSNTLDWVPELRLMKDQKAQRRTT